MNHTIGDRVVKLHHTRVLIYIIYQLVAVSHIRVTGQHDIGIVHVQLWQGTFTDVSGKEGTLLDDMGTGNRVALLSGNIVDAGIAVALQVILYTLVGGCKDSVLQQTSRTICTIGTQHREVRSTLQDADEVSKHFGTFLQELSRCKFGRCVVILRHVLVVVDTRGE